MEMKHVWRIATLAALLAGTPAHAEWITSWSAAPVAPNPALGAMLAAPSFSNRTIRQTLRLSAGGKALRIRLSNAYGVEQLNLGAARVALLDSEGREVPGTSRLLHFAGATSAAIAKGAPLVSDRVDLAVPALARLSLSLYFPGDTGTCTCHTTGQDSAEVSPPGDFTAAPFKAESTMTQRAFVAGVEVDAPNGAGTIAVLGDSISDGVGSTMSANRRWPDLLAERLVKRSGAVWGVANQGISGNRVLNDGMGVSALARFDRDILALPGVKTIIVFEGVNDLGMGFGMSKAPTTGPLAAMRAGLPGGQITAAQVIDGYRQIVARAHALHIRVIGATIAPYKGSALWTEQGEEARQEINSFIRTGGVFDGVLDFDKAFGDPQDPASMRADYHMGDHLHGNDASYRAVAESIDLDLITR
jgi:lysophospholipase L1-like esterase